MNDKKDYISRVYLAAKMRGICTTQAEMAALLDVDRSTLSQAINGKYTDRFFRRVERFAQERGLVDQPEGEKPAVVAETGRPDGFWVPEEFRKTMENMTETIRIQAQVIADLQTRTVESFLGTGKKTYLADGD